MIIKDEKLNGEKSLRRLAYNLPRVDQKGETAIPVQDGILLSKELAELGIGIMDYLKENKYSSSTLKQHRGHLKNLQAFMDSNTYSRYTIAVGQEYLLLKLSEELSPIYYRQIRRTIYMLNCLLEEKPISNNLVDITPVPKQYTAICEAYLEECRHAGNSEATIARKRYASVHFFLTLNFVGCNEISSLTPEYTVKLISPRTSYYWHDYKLLLRFLFKEGYTQTNFEALIPVRRRGHPLPSVYSKEEIDKIISVISFGTKSPKRNKAIGMCVSRYALRAKDIVDLSFNNVDFEKDRLSLIQSKTKIPLDLPLFPEIKEALLDYIENERPITDSTKIFVSCSAPYKSMTTGNVYQIVSNAIKCADIKTTGRKMGPHALRASNASMKVNGGMTFAEARQSIGWSSTSIMRHYVQLDIDRLRLCALEPLIPTESSFFERFLEGKEML